ncbi:MAG: enoyl-CoA hydratase/isomerase family protein [Actinobacteria bacterium]|nr:enoyl-CoA hydratase/isomerase family protein [Actinomycetota bacterium]
MLPGLVAGPEDTVLFALDGPVATITLNRPQRLNALDDELLRTLVGRLRGCAGGEARVVILRGAGRSFCSGYDLKEAPRPASEDLAEARRSAELTQEVTRALRSLPLPVIAVVHGYAIGGGAEIALSCDLLLAAEDAVFGFPESAVGLSVTNGLSRSLPQLVGPMVARELVMVGERFDGRRAAELGLANRAVPGERLEAEAAAMAATLARRAPLSLAALKRLLDRSPGLDLEQALEAEVAEAAALEASADADEGKQAFLERREPRFRGGDA